MGTGFWIKRFVVALSVAVVVLLAVRLAEGQLLADAARFAILWGISSGALFTLIGYIRFRRNPACMIPRSRQEQ